MKGIIIVYLLTAFGTIGSFFNPAFGMFVYVSFSVLRPKYLWGFAGPMDNLSFIVGVAMIAGWVFNGFGSWRLGRGKTIVFMLLAFAAWSGMSALLATNQVVAFRAIKELSKIVVPFFIGVTTLESEKRTRTLIWVTVLAQTWVSYEMNSAYFFQGYNRISDQGFGGLDNNAMGISFVTTIGAALALGLSAKNKTERIVGIVASILILHATLLTFSRGALLALIVVAIVAIVLVPKNLKNLTIVAVVLAVGIRLTGPQLTQRFQSSFATEDRRDDSAQSRIDLWSEAVQVALDHPVLGVGPSNWPIVVGRTKWGTREAHSTWMQTLAEVGIPGVSFLLLFYGITIVKLWRIARGHEAGVSKNDAILAAGIVTSIIGFVVSAQFVTLIGLEAPYYMAMCGVVLLKNRTQEASLPILPVLAKTSVRSAIGTNRLRPLPTRPGRTVRGADAT